MIIIHPNGDIANDNWFVVEYVTNEANNRYNGIRIWRTNMSPLDAEHNIEGADTITIGRPQGPMEFIEAISPDDQFNYYYQAGETLTPTSSPSSAYGAAYESVGYHKYITQMAYSGISLCVGSINADTATLTITIENNPPTINNKAYFEVIDPEKTSIYLDRTDGFHFATITAECELSITDTLKLIDVSTGDSIPVTPILDSKMLQVRLLVSTEHLPKIQLNEQYFLQVAGKLQTYTKAELEIENYDGVITFSDIPISLHRPGIDYQYEWDANYTFRYFRKDATKLCYFAKDNETNQCSLNILDPVTREETVVVLDPLENLQYGTYNTNDHAFTQKENFDMWQVDDQHFMIYFKDIRENACYLACYAIDGKLVDYCKIPDVVKDWECFSASELDERYIIDPNLRPGVNGRIYKVEFTNEKINLTTVSLPHWPWRTGDYKYSSLKKINELSDNIRLAVYAYNSNMCKVCIVKGSNNIIYEQAATAENYCLNVNNEVYFLQLTKQRLTLDVFDENGSLIQQHTLLEDLPIGSDVTYTPFAEYIDDTLFIRFGASSDQYEQSCAITYILAFDKDFNLKYYYHSPSEFVQTGTIAYICNDTFFWGRNGIYEYLCLEQCSDDSGHIQTKLHGKPATEGENGLTDGIACGLCGKIIVPQMITHVGCSGLAGDADCNGTVNVYDALLILQSLAGWDVKVCSINADADGDSMVTIDDVLRTLELCFSGDMTQAVRALQAMMRNMSINQLQIVTQPADQYAAEGQQAEFAVSAVGDGVAYQWYINRNDGMGWVQLKGSVEAAYATSVLERDNDGYQYRCVLTDVYGSELVSDTAVLYVAPEIPETGDRANLVWWALLCVLSLAGIAVMLKKRISA